MSVLKRTGGWVPRRLVSRAVRAALEVEGRGDEEVEVSVVFVSDEEMRRLCREFRGEDRVTDVLSFPAEVPGVLGDIVICLPQAERQAREAGWAKSKEIALLAIHGALHLLGHEDKTEEGRRRMREREREALSLLGIRPEEGGLV